MAKERIEPKFQLLAIASRIVVKIFKVQTLKNLFFVIVNDTVHLIRYQRAILVSLEKKQPSLLALSGQTEIPKDLELRKNWREYILSLQPYDQAQVLPPAQNPREAAMRKQIHIPPDVSLLWVPLASQDKVLGGLLLEERIDRKSLFPQDDVFYVVTEFLAPCYGAAWGRFIKKRWGRDIVHFLRRKTLWVAMILIFLLFFIHVPLRIVAPAEIVPKDPIVVAAPLEGIVEEVVVRPGEKVQEEQILFVYDKQVPLQNLAIAKKEVEILQSEVDRATTLGFTDERSLQELAVLQLKLEKQKIVLALAEYQANRLTVRAPEAGIAVIGNPHEWRGKPVEVGEKVMELSDPLKTMVRIWIPESDNIPFDKEHPIKVYLNISPETSYLASLIYIANESTLDEKNIPSFIAEADWMGKPPDAKIGLKGTAVLYGENVTLFYWIIRRPWAYIRYLTGF